VVDSVRIAVLGAGAIGAYVGAALARGGADVHLVARGANLEALRKNGVRVMSPRGDFEAHPPATDDPTEIGPVDFVFLGLKANSYASAGPLLEPLLKEDTAVIAGQNGIPWWYFHGLDGPYRDHRIETVDPNGAVSEVIPPERAIGCVVYPGTELAEPGVVRHLEGTRFTIGEPDGSMSDRCEVFSEAMIAGGLKCPIEARVRDEIWVKLMGNVAFNPLSVLTGGTLAAMCRHEQMRQLVATMMAESLEIAGAVGAAPSVSIERRLAGAERVGEHKPSTLQDFEAGKPLELAALIDAVVELADLTGVEAPALRAVAATCSLLAETKGLTEAR
jgi:2-dehydropantoate 2-reductase